MEKNLKANGADIEVTTKKGWGHGFEGNYSAEYEAKSRGLALNVPIYYLEDDGMANKYPV